MNTAMESLNETEECDLVPKKTQFYSWPMSVQNQTLLGKIDKSKARYVAKFFKHIEGIQYSDTFASTSKIKTFKILLALSAIEHFFLKQVDINSAYLHSKIDKEVYLLQLKLDCNGKILVFSLKKIKIWTEASCPILIS